MITFHSKRYNGGYGDRIVGMAAACTIARHLHMQFRVVSDTAIDSPHISLHFINQKSPRMLETENLRELWGGKHVVIQANMPIDLGLWKNQFFPELKDMSYELETIQSYREVSRYIHDPAISTESFVCGVQIRCGDTYCMPHGLAQEYISESSFADVSKSIHNYITNRGIRGRVFVTCDTHKIYPFFDQLTSTEVEYVYKKRNDDIHYDFHNSNNRAGEIVTEHQQLQQCDIIITGLRSNFGITAAYCSSACKEVVLYPQFTSFDTSTAFVSKEFSDKAES